MSFLTDMLGKSHLTEHAFFVIIEKRFQLGVLSHTFSKNQYISLYFKKKINIYDQLTNFTGIFDQFGLFELSFFGVWKSEIWEYSFWAF